MAAKIGRVTKSLGGFHSVVLADGKELLLRARGKVKQQTPILVGDWVEVKESGGTAVIERVLPRKSAFTRPSVANVELMVVVMAMDHPPPDLTLLDRILLRAEQVGIAALIVFNKADLADGGRFAALSDPYRAAGYLVLETSAQTGEGVEALETAIGARLAVFAGPSGVGKSSLLNRLLGQRVQEIGEVSAKTRRGRHTTRAVRLLPLATQGWVADTPGFSQLDVQAVEPRLLPGWYPEFRSLEGRCRFGGCLHRSEPGCAVREAVEAGAIDSGRYQRYLRLLAEVEEAYERRY